MSSSSWEGSLSVGCRPVAGRARQKVKDSSNAHARQLFTRFSDAEIRVLTTMLERMRGNLSSAAARVRDNRG